MPNTGNSAKLAQIKAEKRAVEQLIRKIETNKYKLGEASTQKYATFNIKFREELLSHRTLSTQEKEKYNLSYMFKNLNHNAVLKQLHAYLANLNKIINCEKLLSAFAAPTENKLLSITENYDLLALVAQHLDDPFFKENLKRLQYIDLYLYSDKPDNHYRLEASGLKAGMASSLLYHFNLLNNNHRKSLEKIRYTKPEEFEDCAEDMIELLEETLITSRKDLEKLAAENITSHITPLIEKEHTLITTETELKKYLELKQTALENEVSKTKDSFKIAGETLLKKLMSSTTGITETNNFKFQVDTLLTCTTLLAQLQKDYLKYKKEDNKGISSIKNTVLKNINDSYCAMLADPNMTVEKVLASTNILLSTSISLIPYNIKQFFGKENKLQTLILITKNKIAAEKEKLTQYTLKKTAADHAEPETSTKTMSVETIHFNLPRTLISLRKRDVTDLPKTANTLKMK